MDWASNVTQFNVRVAGVFKPTSVPGLQEIVLWANANRRALYPISTGGNWGFGSKLPPAEDCYIVDLSELKGIRSLRPDLLTAQIEVGVTQKQLYNALDGRALFNVTGASEHCSVLANALEKGIGYFGSRVQDIISIEAVTGKGDLITTGTDSLQNAKTAGLYPNGLGPIMTGLFFQSNLGIVTSAHIRLQPPPEASRFIIVRCREAQVPHLMQQLARLQAEETLGCVPHLANRLRTHSTLSPLLWHEGNQAGIPATDLPQWVQNQLEKQGFSEWSAGISIHGSKEMVRARLQHLRRVLAPYRPRVLNPETLKTVHQWLKHFPWTWARDLRLQVNAMLPILNLAVGVPSEGAMKTLSYYTGQEYPGFHMVDSLPIGMRYLTPTIPNDPDEVQAFLAGFQAIFTRFQQEPAITLNLVSPGVLIAITNVFFHPENKQQHQQAEQCFSQALEFCLQNGYLPYRGDILTQRKMLGWHKIASRHYLQELKQIFDPNQVIAPLRYGIEKT